MVDLPKKNRIKFFQPPLAEGFETLPECFWRHMDNIQPTLIAPIGPSIFRISRVLRGLKMMDQLKLGVNQK